MPELPEVETVRAGLESVIIGARVSAVSVLRESCTRHVPGGAAEFAATVMGHTVTAVARRGKFLWWELSWDDAPAGHAMVAHLGMSGQFRVHTDPTTTPHHHCRARLDLDSARGPLRVDFIDQRTFGYLGVDAAVPTADGLPGGRGSAAALVPASIAHIGRDALDPHLSEAEAVSRWRSSARGIKQVLLDQTMVSGIGNIYADEALWRARVHPRRPASSLAPARQRDLLRASQDVMSEALAAGGTSFDALYVNVNGESGYFERGLNAYGRGGEPCYRCGTIMKRIPFAGRSSTFCPKCQRKK